MRGRGGGGGGGGGGRARPRPCRDASLGERRDADSFPRFFLSLISSLSLVLSLSLCLSVSLSFSHLYVPVGRESRATVAPLTVHWHGRKRERTPRET